MMETLAALLFAHVLADFVFQTDAMARAKQARGLAMLALHGLIVLALAVAALGNWHWGLAALMGAHLVIDLAKSLAPHGRLWPFLTDQAAHLVSLVMAAGLLPPLWAGGLWASGGWPEGFWLWTDPLWPRPDWAPALMAAAAGLIVATRAGGFAVGLLVAPFAAGLPEDDGLPRAGQMIGMLERGLVFLMLMVGQPAGIGFLIAAKSILRFSAAAADRRASEYVIIGTLASFGWALATGWATLALLSALPPIGIGPVSP